VKPDAQTLASRRMTATVSLIPAAMVGIFVFGWWAGLMVLVSLASAFLADFILHRFVYKDSSGTRDGMWLFTGLLLGLMMPPNVPWPFPMMGAVLAVFVGKHYLSVDNMPLLQPAAVGLLALHLLGFAWPGANPMLAKYSGQQRWPVLVRGIEPATDVKPKSAAVRKMLRDFFGGDVRNTVTFSQYREAANAGQTAYCDEAGTIPAEARHGPRPIDMVKANPSVNTGGEPQGTSSTAGQRRAGETYDWLSMILGYVPATIGGSSGLALGFGILFIVFTGAASPLVPLFALATMFAGLHFLAWLSSAYVIPENIPIHLLTGSTILALFYFAADPATAPRSFFGKIYAGVALGVLELILRIFTPLAEGLFISVVVVQGLSFVIDQWLAPPVEESRHSGVGITTSSLGRL
jgi:Na+-translocating ferredoxin:NAD+ oxidoreductase RnfD subunit